MADKAISQLTPASVLNDNDLLVLEQSNTAKKMAGSVLRTYIEGMGGIQSITLNADYTLTVTFTNGQTWTSGSIRGQTGNGITGIVLNDDYTLTVTYSDGNTWTSGSIRGQQGETGDAATIQVGTVTKGNDPSVTNSGTVHNAVFDFVLPKGDKGDTGNTGDSVSNAAINSNGHLIITMASGATYDAGVVVGGVSSWDASTQTLNIVG